MSKIRKLDRPPIKEAVIDFQFQPYLDIDKNFIEHFRDLLKTNYSKENIIKLQEISLELKPDSSVINNDRTVQLRGVRFEDENRGFIIQFLRERISISKINNYINFDELINELGILWNELVKLMANRKLSRIGIRFINEIKIKKTTQLANIIENEYLPVIKDYNRAFSQYFIEHKPNTSSIINYVIDFNKEHIIIDIDSYNSEMLKFDNDIIIKKLDDLRVIKNSLFFNLINENFEKEKV